MLQPESTAGPTVTSPRSLYTGLERDERPGLPGPVIHAPEVLNKELQLVARSQRHGDLRWPGIRAINHALFYVVHIHYHAISGSVSGL